MAREVMNTLNFGHLDQPEQITGFAYYWRIFWQEGLKGAVGGGIISLVVACVYLLYVKKLK